MRPIYKTMTSVLIVLMLVYGANAFVYSGSEQTGMYTTICCIEDEYRASLSDQFIRLPISIHVWNKTYYPISNRKVGIFLEIKTFNDTNNVWSDWKLVSNQTKYTDKSGTIKSGFTLQHPGDYLAKPIMYRLSINTYGSSTYPKGQWYMKIFETSTAAKGELDN